MHYLLLYDLAPDYLERRKALRSDHLNYARKAVDQGFLVLGGALTDPVDAAVLLFSADSPEPVKAFAENDPYVLQSLVTSWRVREWTTVVGEEAAHPVNE
jgi:uncharacterized protein